MTRLAAPRISTLCVGFLALQLATGCSQPDRATAPDEPKTGNAPRPPGGNQPRQPTSFSLASIDAGNAHSCGLTAGGKPYCWGSNDYGQLGNHSFADSNVPVPVVTSVPFVDISAGNGFTCALAPLGEAYCWGRLPGTSTNITTPKVVTTSVRFTSISAGNSHVCALTSSGAAYCWGYGANGTLGDGSTNGSSVPVAVAGNIIFSDISAGGWVTCGVDSTGKAYCWGRNYEGALGIGASDVMIVTTTPASVAGNHVFASISAGQEHVCAVTSNGDGYCWGQNEGGTLGDGDQPNDKTAPVPVLGGVAFARISAGGLFHTCGVAVSGQGYCWGTNYFDALGTGGSSDDEPLALTLAQSHYTMIRAGSSEFGHTCGIGINGYAYCWGSNDEGQVGNGTFNQMPYPALVKQP